MCCGRLLHHCSAFSPVRRRCAGLIYIVNQLDYEAHSKYELLVRATDSVSGVYAEVPVNINVEDANDSPPEFTSNAYNVTLLEATPFGTVVLTVSAHDLDSGMHQYILIHKEYSLYYFL